MFPLPEQFSSAAKSQLESQLQIFSTLTSKVFESAEKIIALNLNAGKAALSHTAETAQHLLVTQDPRDFFSYSTSQAQPNIESVLAYSRQLFGIASSTQAQLLEAAKTRLATASPASAPVPVEVQVEAIVEVPAAAPVIEPEPELVPESAPAAVLAPVAEPEPAAPAPAPLPLAATLPIAASAPAAIAPPPAKVAATVKAPVKAEAPVASKLAIKQGPNTASKAVAKPAPKGKRK